MQELIVNERRLVATESLLERFWAPVLIACAALVAAGGVVLTATFTVDDAYITFRYALNLIEHGVWNWDVGATVVEAYTNPLYAFLAIIPIGLGFEPALFFKVLGASCLAGFYTVLARTFAPDLNARAILAAWLATTLFIIPHAFSGLETPAYILGAALVISRFAKPYQFSNLDPALLLLLPLTRPEGAVLSCVLLAHVLRFRLRLKPGQGRTILIALALGLAYMIWRVSYFGDLLPNTFYVKSAVSGWPARAAENLGSTLPYAITALSMIVLMSWLRPAMLIPCLALFAVYTCVYLPSDLQMNYLQRFAIQGLIPVIGAGVGLIAESVSRQPGFVARAVMPTMLVLAINGIYWTSDYLRELRKFAGYSSATHAAHVALADGFARLRDRNYLLAFGDAGLIPYYSGWRSIDTIGLATREIAKNSPEARSAWIAKQQPDVVLTYSKYPDSCETPAFEPGRQEEFNALARERGYVCVPGPRMAEQFYMNGYVKPSVAHDRELLSAFAAAKLQAEANNGGLRERMRNYWTYLVR